MSIGNTFPVYLSLRTTSQIPTLQTEKIVSNIDKHLALDSILADCQHCFRSQRSCETQLVRFVHDLFSNMDGAVNCGHKQTDLIIMDFAKSFDKVPHRRLLHKLDYYGIRGSPTSGSTHGSLCALNK